MKKALGNTLFQTSIEWNRDCIKYVLFIGILMLLRENLQSSLPTSKHSKVVIKLGHTNSLASCFAGQLARSQAERRCRGGEGGTTEGRRVGFSPCPFLEPSGPIVSITEKKKIIVSISQGCWED